MPDEIDAPVSENSLSDVYSSFKKARRKAIAQKVTQAVGGTAETLRTGRSAAATFADRAPKDSGSYLSPLEKVEKKQSLLADISAQEQFYYKQAMQARKDHMQHTRELIKAEMDAQASLMSSRVSASNTTATLRARALGDEIDRQSEELENMTKLSGANENWGEGVTAGLEAIKKRATDEALGQARQYTLGMKKLKEAGQEESKEYKNYQQLKDAAAVAGMRVEEYLVSSQQDALDAAVRDEQTHYMRTVKDRLPDRSPGQVVNAVGYVAARAGLDPSVFTASDKDLAAEMKSDSSRLIEIMDQKNADILGVVARRQSLGSGAPSAALQEAIAKGQQLRQQFPPTPPPPGEMTSNTSAMVGAPGGDATGAGAQAAGDLAMEVGQAAAMKHAGQDLSIRGAEDNYYTVGGVKVPFTTDSMQKQRDLLEVIDNFPEHPPVQELKNKLMAHPQYKQYLAERGYENHPDQAWREFKKDMNAKQRSDRKEFRQKKRENVLLGKHKGGLGRKTFAKAVQNVTGPPKKASTVVTGADRGAPEKVDDDNG